jgi:hypothetical protein
MMEATEHGEGNDVALGRALRRDGGQLVGPLVRARGVVVADNTGTICPNGLSEGAPGENCY